MSSISWQGSCGAWSGHMWRTSPSTFSHHQTFPSLPKLVCSNAAFRSMLSSCRRLKFLCLARAIRFKPEASYSRQRLLGLRLETSVILNQDPDTSLAQEELPQDEGAWLKAQSAQLRGSHGQPRRHHQSGLELPPLLPVTAEKLNVSPSGNRSRPFHSA